MASERIRKTEKDINRVIKAGDFPKLAMEYLDWGIQCPSCDDQPILYSKVTETGCVDARKALQRNALMVAIKKYADAIGGTGLSRESALVAQRVTKSTDKVAIDTEISEQTKAKNTAPNLLAWARLLAQIDRRILQLLRENDEAADVYNIATDAA